MKKPLILCILDGFGIAPEEGNAIFAAKTPNLDRIFSENPTTAIGASGMDVGLPDGQMGNSEVGHTNIGAGRVVYQELTRITKSIKDGDFFENEALKGAMENCLKNGSALHLMGLLSDGGVHSHIEHLYGLVKLAHQNGLKRVFIHALLDGRDVPPRCAGQYIEALQNHMNQIGLGEIAVISGRYYAMDRDNNYDRVKLAYDAMTKGEGLTAPCGICGIQASYDREETDEFVPQWFNAGGFPEDDY